VFLLEVSRLAIERATGPDDKRVRQKEGESHQA
jgi:hypothetical protein